MIKNLKPLQFILSISLSIALTIIISALVVEATSSLTTNLVVDGTATINGTGNNYFAGNVGIGTTPGQKLDVVGTIKSQGLILSGNADMKIYNDTKNASNNSAFYFTSSATAANSYIIANGSSIATRGYIVASYGDGWTGKNITMSHDGSDGNIYSNSGDLVLSSASGSVGIGTSDPASGSKLDVNGNIYADSITNDNSSSGLTLNSSGGANIELYGSGAYSGGAYYDANSHNFRPQTTGSTFMTINSSGNVGIGTTSPGQKFTVAASTDGDYISASPNESNRPVFRIADKDGNADPVLQFVRGSNYINTYYGSDGYLFIEGKTKICDGTACMTLSKQKQTTGSFTFEWPLLELTGTSNGQVKAGSYLGVDGDYAVMQYGGGTFEDKTCSKYDSQTEMTTTYTYQVMTAWTSGLLNLKTQKNPCNVSTSNMFDMSDVCTKGSALILYSGSGGKIRCIN